jgi:hypothetical protein
LVPISWIGFFLAARAISMSDFTSAMGVCLEDRVVVDVSLCA